MPALAERIRQARDLGTCPRTSTTRTRNGSRASSPAASPTAGHLDRSTIVEAAAPGFRHGRMGSTVTVRDNDFGDEFS
jgi:hypothetical protein